MKALVFQTVNEPLAYEDVTLDAPGDDEVIVTMKAAALNHRDVFITQGLYPGLEAGVIVGSDGCGVVDGREIIINPSLNWGDDERFQGKDYTILGMPVNGTFAEQFLTQRKQLHDKPAHLSIAQAAALPLGGLTAYRVLFTRCQLQAGERVLISGIGGGVALFALQFALAAGAEVYVTSSSADKIARAVDMGATGGVNYKEDGWARQIRKETGGFDVIIDSAGGKGFADLVKTTRPGCRIGIYGGGAGNFQNVSPQLLFFRQVSIHGSTMGSDKEFAEMVDFVNTHQIVPVVDSEFDLADGNDALARMDQGLQFGKIVLNIGN